MVATYSEDTYDSETYDTGEEPVKKHGLPFSVFSWSTQEPEKTLDEPLLVERELEAISAVTAVRRSKLQLVSKITQVSRGLVKCMQTLTINYELGDAIAAFKAFRAFNAMRHLKGHFIVKLKNGKVAKTFDIGNSNDEQKE